MGARKIGVRGIGRSSQFAERARRTAGVRRRVIAMVQRRVEVTPRSAFRMPRLIGRDGVMRRRGSVLLRLVHVGEEPVVVRAAQVAPDRVVLAAEGPSGTTCGVALDRMRFALGVDEDLTEFHQRFRVDPLIGPVVRLRPWLRPMRRPEPFEALAWAITEQLIDFPRAAEIQRRIVIRLGRRCPRTGLRDLPTPERLARLSPAQLEAFDLSGRRAVAMVRAAREVAAGRVDLHDPDHETGWRRLLAIPTIGRWTVEILAYQGQGRLDVVPAGDLNLLKLVGRLSSGGNPHARATEDDVRAFFAPYAPYGGLAATYALSSPRAAGPHPGGTRWSGRAADPLAA
jgi:3-methyladenine DNA glycosylase/8-oxoguanine DNA glycosylase